MNLRPYISHGPTTRLSPPKSPRSVRAFTMVEIALSLAIIGFALVAIIGVLPAGMSVQKDNREQTIINLDAAYLMDAIRSGTFGQDDLTNYIVSITQSTTRYQANPFRAASGQVINIFTPNQSLINGVAGASCLTNGSNIIGLLSMPKYLFENPNGVVEIWSNSVTAVFRGINGPAVDQGASQASRDFAFQYEVAVEIGPSAEYAYTAANGQGWYNLLAPASITNANPSGTSTDDAFARHLQNNLYDIRLTFRWPVFGAAQLGGGKQVFRSSVSGAYRPGTNVPFIPFPPPSSLLPNGAQLYFMQPGSYTPQ